MNETIDWDHKVIGNLFVEIKDISRVISFRFLNDRTSFCIQRCCRLLTTRKKVSHRFHFLGPEAICPFIYNLYSLHYKRMACGAVATVLARSGSTSRSCSIHTYWNYRICLGLTTYAFILKIEQFYLFWTNTFEFCASCAFWVET